MSVTVIVGEQRGDEGKGRFTDMLAEQADIVGRGQGGDNAGHTVKPPNGGELKLHSAPSGVAHEGVENIIGRGCLVNAKGFVDEIQHIRDQGFEVSPENLRISSGAHLILPHHISLDEIRESGPQSQGSTKKGISPVSGDKYDRRQAITARTGAINDNIPHLYNAITIGLESQKAARERAGLPEIDPYDAADEYIEKARQIGQFVSDTEIYLNQRLNSKEGARVIAEGAQAFWLDIDHGMWPYVTSSSTTAGGVINGLGIPPLGYVTDVIGVSKLVQSHVGGGPFVTEIEDAGLLEQLHGDMTTIDAEKGTTTGRVRRLGYLDLPAVKRAQIVNGTSQMAVTKLDWIPRFGDTFKVCTSYTRERETLEYAPSAAYELEESTPNYMELPTWKEDIQGVRTFDGLPANAQNFIRLIEKITKKHVTMIGVGPGREQVIDRRSSLGFTV